MVKVALTSALRNEYVALFNTCSIKPDKQEEMESEIAGILLHQARYRSVGEPLICPYTMT